MNEKLTAQFGAVTISIDARDVVRTLALQALTAAAPAPGARSGAPAIGEYWAEQGGIYCGRLVDAEDQIYALIAAPRSQGEFNDVDWTQAGARCAAIEIDDFADWALPDRAEALALWERLQPKVKGSDEAFAEEAYWTSRQYERNSGSAWYQYFGYGGQGRYDKGARLRARAVRRVVI